MRNGDAVRMLASVNAAMTVAVIALRHTPSEIVSCPARSYPS